jgi:hypothetical protein
MKSTLSLALIVCLASFSVPLTAQDRVEAGLIRAAIGREAARLEQTAAPNPSLKPEVSRQSWPVRHPVLVGMLIGTAVGVAIDSKEYATGRRPGDIGTLVGAGIGALGGLVAHAMIGTSLRYTTLSEPDAFAVKRVVGKLGVGGQVVVISASSGPTRGRIQAIGQDEFSVVPEGGTAAMKVAYADVRSIRAKPLSAGTKVGIAAAVGSVLVILAACAVSCGG